MIGYMCEILEVSLIIIFRFFYDFVRCTTNPHSNDVRLDLDLDRGVHSRPN